MPGQVGRPHQRELEPLGPWAPTPVFVPAGAAAAQTLPRSFRLFPDALDRERAHPVATPAASGGGSQPLEDSRPRKGRSKPRLPSADAGESAPAPQPPDQPVVDFDWSEPAFAIAAKM